MGLLLFRTRLKGVKLIILGIFIGIVLSYNLLLNEMEYRISFYGYHQVGNEILPIIKIRKKLKVMKSEAFSRLDEGKDIEVERIELRMGESYEFSKEDIRKEYCK